MYCSQKYSFLLHSPHSTAIGIVREPRDVGIIVRRSDCVGIFIYKTARGCVPVLPALDGGRGGGGGGGEEFKASLGYLTDLRSGSGYMKPCLKRATIPHYGYVKKHNY